MRLRDHKRTERRRTDARPGFRFNTDLNRWEFCHWSDCLWRPLALGTGGGSLISFQARKYPVHFISYDETWAEETAA